jgi:hypothetical protein
MMPSLFFPPACPNCGQQRNRCICLPFLIETAHVATVAPATLPPLTVASDFDAPNTEELPADRLPNGARAIRLPHNDC